MADDVTLGELSIELRVDSEGSLSVHYSAENLSEAEQIYAMEKVKFDLMFTDYTRVDEEEDTPE